MESRQECGETFFSKNAQTNCKNLKKAEKFQLKKFFFLILFKIPDSTSELKGTWRRQKFLD